jgi:hypothetical protein
MVHASCADGARGVELRHAACPGCPSHIPRDTSREALARSELPITATLPACNAIPGWPLDGDGASSHSWPSIGRLTTRPPHTHVKASASLSPAIYPSNPSRPTKTANRAARRPLTRSRVLARCTLARRNGERPYRACNWLIAPVDSAASEPGQHCRGHSQP